MAYNNDTVAENFILQTGLKCNGSTCNYVGDTFYSYSTAFAKVDLANKVVLISNDSMTSTSSKHHSAIVHQAIVHDYKILPVPLYMFEHAFPNSDVINDRFERLLEAYSKGTNLALSDNRFNYLNTMNRYEEYNRYIKYQPSNLHKFVVIEAQIDDVEFIKSLQKQRRLELKEKKNANVHS